MRGELRLNLRLPNSVKTHCGTRRKIFFEHLIFSLQSSFGFLTHLKSLLHFRVIIGDTDVNLDGRHLPVSA